MRVKKLSDLANYQENAVVSSELINKEGGIVTIFAFDKGLAPTFRLRDNAKTVKSGNTKFIFFG